MIEIGQILLIATIAFILGYYSRSRTKELKIITGIEETGIFIDKFTSTYDLLNEERKIYQNLEKLRAREKTAEKTIIEFESKAETAQHKKWKEQKEEKLAILKVEKEEKLAVKKISDNTMIEQVKNDNNIESSKPDFLK